MSEEALRRWYWAGVIVAALALWVPWWLVGHPTAVVFRRLIAPVRAGDPVSSGWSARRISHDLRVTWGLFTPVSVKILRASRH